MAKKLKLKKPAREESRADEDVGSYFEAEDGDVTFFTSGCALLDCVLGGGWPVGRMTNIIGDKSTGKTLLAIEACANFAKKFPDSPILYREAEAAFDIGYAESVGLPVEHVDFGDEDNPIATIEDFFEDLEEFLDKHPDDTPALYILDSLDSLSDREELDRDFDKGSYGMNKQKKLGELFRRLVKKMHNSQVCLMIISQIRENIGVAFGEKYRRSGGKAMDFYASQCLWLAQTGQIKMTRKGIERTVGVKIKAQIKKNKVGRNYRQCDFPILFGFGIDDVFAHVAFLNSVKAMDKAPKTKAKIGSVKGDTSLSSALLKMSNADYSTIRKELSRKVPAVWEGIEQDFLVDRRKYD